MASPLESGFATFENLLYGAVLVLVSWTHIAFLFAHTPPVAWVQARSRVKRQRPLQHHLWIASALAIDGSEIFSCRTNSLHGPCQTSPLGLSLRQRLDRSTGLTWQGDRRTVATQSVICTRWANPVLTASMGRNVKPPSHEATWNGGYRYVRFST